MVPAPAPHFRPNTQPGTYTSLGNRSHLGERGLISGSAYRTTYHQRLPAKGPFHTGRTTQRFPRNLPPLVPGAPTILQRCRHSSRRLSLRIRPRYIQVASTLTSSSSPWVTRTLKLTSKRMFFLNMINEPRPEFSSADSLETNGNIDSIYSAAEKARVPERRQSRMRSLFGMRDSGDFVAVDVSDGLTITNMDSISPTRRRGRLRKMSSKSSLSSFGTSSVESTEEGRTKSRIFTDSLLKSGTRARRSSSCTGTLSKTDMGSSC